MAYEDRPERGPFIMKIMMLDSLGVDGIALPSTVYRKDCQECGRMCAGWTSIQAHLVDDKLDFVVYEISKLECLKP